MALDEAKVISASRVPNAWGTSRDYANRIMQEAESRGLINPEKTPTGRKYFSVSEFKILSKLAGIAA